MENAVDALKMAAAVLVFIVALSVAILGFTKAREAATAVLSKSDLEYYNTENIKVTEDRIVGIETIIPTLYSYYKEGYTLLFYKGLYNEGEQRIEGNITPVTLYYSEALPSKLAMAKLLNKSDERNQVTYNGTSYSRAIYGFDVDDEDTRQEPWLNDELHAKEFMKSFINNLSGDLAPKYDMSRSIFMGSPTNKKLNNKLEMNFNLVDSEDSLIYALIQHDHTVNSLSVATNARFVERTGTYSITAESYRDEEDNIQTNYSVDSSVIEFSNDETIQNEEGTQKRVIQYIYIGNK